MYLNTEEGLRCPTSRFGTCPCVDGSEDSSVSLGDCGVIFCNSDTWGSV